jgi:hypothetical protein
MFVFVDLYTNLLIFRSLQALGVLGYEDHETLKGIWVVPPTQDLASWRELYGPTPSTKTAKGEATVKVLQTRIAHYLNFPASQVRDAAPMLPISELPTAELQRLYAEFGSVLQSRSKTENNKGAETENNEGAEIENNQVGSTADSGADNASPPA